MSDEPESLVLIYLRRLDASMVALREDMTELKQRFTTLEIQVGALVATEQSHYGHVMQRLDRVEMRLDRIERRLDLVDHSA